MTSLKRLRSRGRPKGRPYNSIRCGRLKGRAYSSNRYGRPSPSLMLRGGGRGVGLPYLQLHIIGVEFRPELVQDLLHLLVGIVQRVGRRLLAEQSFLDSVGKDLSQLSLNRCD